MSGLVERLLGGGLVLRDPALLLLVLLVPLALWWRRRGDAPAILFAPATLLRRRRTPSGQETAEDAPSGSWRVALLWLPVTLHVLALLVVVLALARPAARVERPAEREGIDILLCLDTSSSMTTNDMDRQRTRLEVAQDAAAAFVRTRPDDRIGLLTFARYPDLRCPLTSDHEALTRILERVETVESDGPEDATGLGAAVARAAQVLDGSGATSRVVILLTDGEENVALAGAPGEIAPVHAAQLCERLDVRVYPIVAGVGRRDAAGAWVPLDTRPVRDLAARTGGAFHEARDAGAMAAVYARIDTLETSPFEEPRTALEDRYLAFLAAALFLLLGGSFLSSTVLDVRP